MQPSTASSEVVAYAWKHGQIWYKLDANQKSMYWAFRETQHPKFVFDVARRVGKSTIMTLIGIEDCIRRPNAIVKYGAATQEMVREIILPLARQLMEDCPREMIPKWMPTENAFLFKNGSRMKLAGLDKQKDNLRGTALDIALIDEAAFVTDLEYVVQSVLVPQMQGRPHARILLGSTPPQSPSHKWSTRFVPEAKANGAYIHRTIEDNPRLSLAERNFFISEAGGKDAVENRRENYAEHIVDEDLSIIPEFGKVKDQIVREVERPGYFDAYVSLDPGFNDLTVALFAYVNFETSKLVIEADLALAKSNTSKIAKAIRDMEHKLWHKKVQLNGKPQPYLRVSDVDLRLISDLHLEHNLSFVPTRKDDKETAINAVRIAIQRRDILINPRCVTLIAHLSHGIWNKSRTSYDRSGDYGHFDAIDALVYLVRNVQKGRNPFPRFTGGERPETHYMPERPSFRPDLDEVKKLFKPQRRRW